MKEEVILIDFVSKDLYEWGCGWVSEEKYQKWNNFWENIHSTFWKFAKSTDLCCSDTLYSTYGSIYLHPMKFRSVLRTICKCTKLVNGEDVPYFSEVEDLKELLDKCAEEVGFTYTFKCSKPIEVDFDMVDA